MNRLRNINAQLHTFAPRAGGLVATGDALQPLFVPAK
jgi:hypothetical protein